MCVVASWHPYVKRILSLDWIFTIDSVKKAQYRVAYIVEVINPLKPSYTRVFCRTRPIRYSPYPRCHRVPPDFTGKPSTLCQAPPLRLGAYNKHTLTQ